MSVVESIFWGSVSMGKMMLLCSLFFFLSEPLLLGGAFLALLLSSSLDMGANSGFMGLVLFVVYVGGTMVLFTYCLMLSPLQFFSNKKKYYSVSLLFVSGVGLTGSSMSIYEFFYFSGILVMIGILLFIVMLSVVEMIDFSRGSLRVECGCNYMLSNTSKCSNM